VQASASSTIRALNSAENWRRFGLEGTPADDTRHRHAVAAVSTVHRLRRHRSLLHLALLAHLYHFLSALLSKLRKASVSLYIGR